MPKTKREITEAERPQQEAQWHRLVDAMMQLTNDDPMAPKLMTDLALAARDGQLENALLELRSQPRKYALAIATIQQGFAEVVFRSMDATADFADAMDSAPLN